MPYRGKMARAGSTQHDFLTPSLAEEEEMYHLNSTRTESLHATAQKGKGHIAAIL